jgi:hypothetical protein
MVGFQVELKVAVVVFTAVQGVHRLAPGDREVLLDPVADTDDDHVVRSLALPEGRRELMATLAGHGSASISI